MTDAQTFGSAPVGAGAGAGESCHSVHFYESDQELVARVAAFIGQGLAVGESGIVIATESHRRSLVQALRALDVDVDAASAVGKLNMLDAESTLARLMIGATPDEERFRAVIGSVLSAAIRRGAAVIKVRAYGEMVDLLWRAGNRAGALRLEELWERLRGEHSFDLLCGYALEGFSGIGDAGSLRDVCDHHATVVQAPPAPVGAGGPGDLRVLAAEIARRKVVEESLRRCVQDLQIAEERERQRAVAERRAREEAEAQLVLSQSLSAAMAENVRVNDLLVGVLAHDLRSPLAAVVTAAELLKSREPVLADGRNGKALDRVILSAQRMARMIEQLLDYTRLRVGGGIAVEPQAGDLAALARQVMDELQAAHPDAAIEIGQAGDLAGSWDCDRLSQLFSNLVGNAIQHGAAGGRVQVFLDGTAAERVEVRVHNMGAIAADLLGSVFEPLKGGNRRRGDRNRGLGLGLFISKRIAEAHGGDVTVASNPAAGTTFSVSLPRKSEATAVRAFVAGAGQGAPPERPAPPSSPTGAPPGGAAGKGQAGSPHQLRESEARFRLLVEAVKDYAIFMLDPTGHVMTWNAGAQRIKGYSASDIIGQHFSRFYGAEEIRGGKCERELEVAALEGRFEDEGWRVRKDGTRFWANVVITALRGPDGVLVGFAKVTRDLTDRRQLEMERLRLARAEEAIRLRDEFLSLAAHELKTPLTVLQMQLDTLNERMEASDDSMALKLTRATQSSERLGSLIESLMDVSRIATGRFAIEPHPFDIVDCVARVMDTLRASADRAGCTLIFEEAGAPIHGCWDRLRIEQVVTNLLANAIKYGAGRPVHVTVRPSPGPGAADPGSVTMEVRDHGPGIPSSEMGRIFGRFERASSIRNYGGLGLGLYVIQEIVSAHGGTVSAENCADGGARFTIRLPLRAAAPGPIQAPRPSDVN